MFFFPTKVFLSFSKWLTEPPATNDERVWSYGAFPLVAAGLPHRAWRPGSMKPLWFCDVHTGPGSPQLDCLFP